MAITAEDIAKYADEGTNFDNDSLAKYNSGASVGGRYTADLKALYDKVAARKSSADITSGAASEQGQNAFNASGVSNEDLGTYMANTLYGKSSANIGSDASNYADLVKSRLGQDYAGADLIRQQASANAAKLAGQSGLSGTNTAAMQNQLYRKGIVDARTANQDYQDKALAAYGRNISARQSGISGIEMGARGLTNASKPTPVANYDSGLSIICTELYTQGKITKGTWIRASIYGQSIDKNIYFGYLAIATPIVKLMKKSDKFSNLFIGWSKSIAKQKPNLFTKLMMPLCWSIGYVRKITKKETFRVA